MDIQDQYSSRSRVQELSGYVVDQISKRKVFLENDTRNWPLCWSFCLIVWPMLRPWESQRVEDFSQPSYRNHFYLFSWVWVLESFCTSLSGRAPFFHHAVTRSLLGLKILEESLMSRVFPSGTCWHFRAYCFLWFWIMRIWVWFVAWEPRCKRYCKEVLFLLNATQNGLFTLSQDVYVENMTISYYQNVKQRQAVCFTAWRYLDSSGKSLDWPHMLAGCPHRPPCLPANQGWPIFAAYDIAGFRWNPHVQVQRWITAGVWCFSRYRPVWILATCVSWAHVL